MYFSVLYNPYAKKIPHLNMHQNEKKKIDFLRITTKQNQMVLYYQNFDF